MSTAYLLTGSNLGKREVHLKDALKDIILKAGTILRCSPVYESPPWGFEHPVPFLNQALEIATPLSPGELLNALLSIEKKHGRERKSNGYSARSLDIDILFYENMVVNEQELQLPHPRLHLRRFALLPLADIAPRLFHPVLKKPVSELLNECTDPSRVLTYSPSNCPEEGNKG